MASLTACGSISVIPPVRLGKSHHDEVTTPTAKTSNPRRPSFKWQPRKTHNQKVNRPRPREYTAPIIAWHSITRWMITTVAITLLRDLLFSSICTKTTNSNGSNAVAKTRGRFPSEKATRTLSSQTTHKTPAMVAGQRPIRWASNSQDRPPKRAQIKIYQLPAINISPVSIRKKARK